MKDTSLANNNKLGKLGIIMGLAFYIFASIMVICNKSGHSLISPNVKTLTIAHWQLEDGFRQGVDAAIKEYEKIKLDQGVKVKIIQTTVPFRGYQQWFVTQLISGKPADIIELTGSSQLQSQYFLPLSNYIGQPNPYNQDTPLEGIPWKDTYIDGMNTSLDSVYAEYFGIGTFFHTLRIYANKDLIRNATGSSQMPRSFDEWMNCCKKLQGYGKKIGKPIIPIGVRGLDKATIFLLFRQFFSQLNGNLNDDFSLFGLPKPSPYELLISMAEDQLDFNRLSEAVELIRETGQYFSDGFTSMDLEQTKFLFFTGNVGFFPEGTWDAWSIVKNSPFEVDVITLPSLSSSNRFYRDFTGRISEMGVGVGGKFGISKASKYPELALDFLQFFTSYKINQMTMMDYAKWPPAVIRAEYKGLLKKFAPVAGDARLEVALPFCLEKKSMIKMLETLERIITVNIPDSQKYFWRQYFSNISYLIEEVQYAAANSERQLFDIEGLRSGSGIGLQRQSLNIKEHHNLKQRQLIGLENLADRNRQRYLMNEGLMALQQIVLDDNTERKEN